MYLQQYQVRILDGGSAGGDPKTLSDDLNNAWERGWRLHALSLLDELDPLAVFERRPECGDKVYSEPLARDETETEMEEVK